MAIHAISWDVTTFDTKPIGTSLLGQVDDYIKATRQAVRQRFQPEHNFDMANDDMQGVHKEGSARAWVSDSNPTSPQPAYATNETNANKGRMRVSAANKQLHVHDGSAWVSGTPLITVAATAPTSPSAKDIFVDTANKLVWVYSGSAWVQTAPKITVSSADPSGGADGDIWFKVL